MTDINPVMDMRLW